MEKEDFESKAIALPYNLYSYHMHKEYFLKME